jgi:ABC-type transport system substrate-binding protein
MKRFLLPSAAAVLAVLVAMTAANAQKRGGTLRVFQYDSPASMSIHEEALNSAQNPMMAVFNNLVLFKQDVPQNRMDTIVPDLAAKWSWNAGMTELTFQLRRGVSWHDGKPFTAADVKCTWDLILGNGTERLRANPRKAWYRNLESVSTKGDTVTFHLKRPQPAFIALLASGYSPVYPCHVSPQAMRQHPIGTGPFKFVSYKPIDQLKEIYIDGELEVIETANWFPKVYRKDYKVGLNLTGAGVDDPDAQFYENYVCGSDRNYTGYCNPELDKLIDRQVNGARQGKAPAPCLAD